MRLLEIIFLGLLIIQFIMIAFGFLKSRKRLKYFIFFPVLAALLHLIIEGYRWQMIPAYILLIFMILILIISVNPRKYIKIIRNIGLVLLLILGIFLPMVLPVLKFTNDNGEFKVGVKQFQVIDKERREILTEVPDDFREISVRLFYPTSNQQSGSVAYIPDFQKIKNSYEKKLGWPPFLLDYLKYFKIEAQNDAAIISKEKFPLVIYSHGLTNNYTEAGGRMMNLAARGYVVAAINHTYSSDYAIMANGEVVGYKALSQLGDPIEKVDSVKTIIANQWVEDVQSLIEHLKTTEYSDAIDFNTIGLIGFSAGGTMSTLGSYKIDNVKAAINLDGTPRGIDFHEKPQCPQLFMFSEPEQFSDAQIEAWGITREMIDGPIRLINDRAQEILSDAPEGSYIVRISGTKHSNFIEYSLISPLSKELDIGGSINSWKCYEMINEMLYAFLDKNLKNKSIGFPGFQDVEVTKN